MEITIHPFQPADQAEVKKLILSGLAEHWGTLDPEKNTDLEDISRSYAGGIFLVAKLHGRVIACGALVPRSIDTAEIVRMSVAADMRRQGVGGRMLRCLRARAEEQGFSHVILETTETWKGEIAFYQHFGFRETHRRAGDIWFALDLPPHTG